MPKRLRISSSPDNYLVEVAWEVCNQVGGIYTVIRSKIPCIMDQWGGRYCMVGPYLNKNILTELEPLDDSADIFGLAASNLKKKGYDVQYAEWLVTGKPRVVLLNPNVIEERTMNVVKYLLWKNHGISTADNPLINQVVAFAFLTKLFFDELVAITGVKKTIIGHFHEWMAGLPILDIKREAVPVKT